MKKHLLLLFLLVFSCICHAQIQTKILDLEIGVSTEQNVVNFLNRNKYSFKKEDMVLVAKNVKFAKAEWEETGFLFHEGKLVAIMFMEKTKGSNGEYMIVKSALKEKYNEYIANESNMGTVYFDKNMAVLYIGEGKLACLAYVSANHLMDIMSKVMGEL